MSDIPKLIFPSEFQGDFNDRLSMKQIIEEIIVLRMILLFRDKEFVI